MDGQTLLFIAAVIFALLNALSLLAKAESIRGLGRVVGGFSWIAFGIFAMLLPAAQAWSFATASYILIGCGVIALVSGARKFVRRNKIG